MIRILNVVGARPNLMKTAPLVDEMKRYSEIKQILVHTGQHYDHQMSRVFFDELAIPEPDLYLSIGSGSHAEQTAKLMLAFERVVREQKPDLILVVGDVNSTLACALVGAKLVGPVAHVGAGLRSFDKTMPEVINRILIDQIAEFLFTTESSANDNLRREGIAEKRIHFVGNVMIDTVLLHKERALEWDILRPLGLSPGSYALVTIHSPSNVDEPEVLADILEALNEIGRKLPVVSPAHPRTVKRIKEFGLGKKSEEIGELKVTAPLGYLEFSNLMANARLVLTDLGGIQEEIM